jgi:hypothetical protein
LAVRRIAVVLLAAICIVPWGVRANGASSTVPGVEPALERFLARPDEPLTQYRAVRHIEARNDRFNLTGSLDAVTEVVPGGRFTYTVIREEGSEYIRRKVLHPLLENEAELSAAGDASRYALTATNYDVAAGGLATDGTVKLFARARRRDLGLIDGAVFVTSDDADLVRVEGRLVKNPSFWTSRVDLVRQYTRIAGVRVPIRVDTVAHVRLAGVSTMTMTYDYQMVDGIELTPRIASGN